MNKFGIHIKVKDIQKSYRFYKAFGFKPVFAYGNSKWQEQLKADFKGLATVDEKYEGVTFEFNGALLEIANGHIAVKTEVFKESISSSKVSAMVDTDSIEQIVSICKLNNIEIAVQPRTFHWGSTEVVIADPDGLIIVFREKSI
jgi:catechol 2,3-dioxygenase-like lactoylglutathione lyase family enzyme